MIVDGKAIKEEMGKELARRIALLGWSPKLVVLEVKGDFASEKFVALKESFAKQIGVTFDKHSFPLAITTEQFVETVKAVSADPTVHGIVVQLPLPEHIDTNAVLAAIHPTKDVDALGSTPRVMPPVAGAVAEILVRQGVTPKGKRAVVVGYGRLVGKPVAQWLVDQGAHIHVVDKDTPDAAGFTKSADIIVSGAGVPGLLKPDMVTPGVALIDAGTSESAGKLVGDIDPLCAEKASLFTPVPGGVGPVTVAVLFKNLLDLIARQDAF